MVKLMRTFNNFIRKTQEFFREKNSVKSKLINEPKIYLIGDKSDTMKTIINITKPIGYIFMFLSWLLFGKLFNIDGLGLKTNTNNISYYETEIKYIPLFNRVLLIYTLLLFLVFTVFNLLINYRKSLDFILELLEYSIYNKKPKSKNFNFLLILTFLIFNFITTGLVIYSVSVFTVLLFIINTCMYINIMYINNEE